MQEEHKFGIYQNITCNGQNGVFDEFEPHVQNSEFCTIVA